VRGQLSIGTDNYPFARTIVRSHRQLFVRTDNCLFARIIVRANG